ncbi:hypothetical protein BDV95DRAFT_639781 [Massariosphaeria phaeospora]|uniref:Uncharacterized protein n=1 Tax=Massariosphaeria phaeospora TaxID=100035 RepID=A0A7C8I427_9PLEO|nr:hypothetical protein BDV95DRAFT_639781 [Massariosphaeria phaeospora]
MSPERGDGKRRLCHVTGCKRFGEMRLESPHVGSGPQGRFCREIIVTDGGATSAEHPGTVAGDWRNGEQLCNGAGEYSVLLKVLASLTAGGDSKRSMTDSRWWQREGERVDRGGASAATQRVSLFRRGFWKSNLLSHGPLPPDSTWHIPRDHVLLLFPTPRPGRWTGPGARAGQRLLVAEGTGEGRSVAARNPSTCWVLGAGSGA